MKTTIISTVNLDTHIKNTLDYIDEVVAKTMGPGGSNSLLNTDKINKITKDGISVLLSIVPENPYEDAILNIIKDACLKTNKNVGDGTTGTAVLISEIVKEAFLYLNHDSVNKIKFRNGLNKAADYIVEKLKKYSIPVKDISTEEGLERVNQIAKISTNNDEELADIITTIFKNTGKSANVKLEFSNTVDTEYEIVDGFQVDKGYISQYFADDTGIINFENPNIFVSEKSVTNLAELNPVIAYHKQYDIPFIIIAPKFDVTVLNSLIMHKMRGLKVCCILLNEFGVIVKDVLEDIAILTGATMISDITNISFRHSQCTSPTINQVSHITGSAKVVNINEDKTIIIDGCGDPTSIFKRIESVKAKIEKEKDFTEKEVLRKRLDNLEGGISIISIGGNTAARARERYDLAEDAINSCKAAIEYGILPGAGSSLAQIKNQNHEDFLNSIKEIGYSEFLGAQTLLKVCDSIAIKVIKNASDEVTLYKLLNMLKMDSEFEFKTFDIENELIDDCMKIGIIDPTEVIINEILNSAEGAGTIISLSSVISNKRDKTDNIAELITKSTI